MEENVALDSKKQKKFAKSIKGIKNLLKKNADKPHKPAVLAPKDGEQIVDKKNKKHKDHGLVYLSHIPHGFYEHQMTQYFKQFGMVTNVRVIRSPRTGRSKGFAFVEFREPAVAEIVAETMNNYLMGKRLIKAVVVPPEKQKRHALRKHWTSINNPTAERRRKMKKVFNATKDEAGDLHKARTLYKMLEKKKKKFRALGLDIDFFTPVDVPEALLANKETKQESERENKVKAEDAKKKENKAKTVQKLNIKKEQEPERKQTNPNQVKSKKEVKKEQGKNKLKQNEKEKKLKDAGVKLPENFIKIQPESGEESDSSVEFDSDEYEKMLENDSDASSGGESEDEDDGDESEDEDDGDESEDGNEVEDDETGEEELPPLIPIKVKKGKKPFVVPPPQPKKGAKQVNVKKEQKKPLFQLQKKGQLQGQPKKPQAQGQIQKKPHVQEAHEGKAMKRKNLQPEVSPKKPKFEKQDKKQRNKQFKKKNKAN